MKQKELILARWIVGIVFIFSGSVKGIDPMGFNYKIVDYLDAMNLKVFEFLSFPTAFLVPFIEFSIGIGLLSGILIKVWTKLSFVFMLFFTPLTLYVALKNPVTDCGCFGDALVISNWQTFYKNIVLILLTVFLLINRKNLVFTDRGMFRKITFFTLLICYFSIVYWSYNHEPIFDFRPYKVGVNIIDGMRIPEGSPTDIYRNVFRYRNLKTNEVEKFGDNNYPWNDTINWKFESMDTPQLIKKGYKPPIHDFSIQTIDNINVTDSFLRDTTFTFFVITYDLEKTVYKKQMELNTLAEWAKRKGYHFVGLTATSGAALRKFQLEHLPAYKIMFSDQTTLKTIIRSNPGLLLMKKGIIVKKWHFNDFPNPDNAEKIINSEMNKRLNK